MTAENGTVPERFRARMQEHAGANSIARTRQNVAGPRPFTFTRAISRAPPNDSRGIVLHDAVVHPARAAGDHG